MHSGLGRRVYPTACRGLVHRHNHSHPTLDIPSQNRLRIRSHHSRGSAYVLVRLNNAQMAAMGHIVSQADSTSECKKEKRPICLSPYLLLYFSTSLPTSLPPSLPPYFPTSLPPHLPTSLPPYFPTSLPPYFPTSLPPYFPTSLPPYFPTSLHPYFPTFLPSYLPTSLPSYFPTSLPP
eukprot:1196035-Prorocentrum_minimum.AAC.3